MLDVETMGALDVDAAEAPIKAARELIEKVRLFHQPWALDNVQAVIFSF